MRSWPRKTNKKFKFWNLRAGCYFGHEWKSLGFDQKSLNVSFIQFWGLKMFSQFITSHFSHDCTKKKLDFKWKSPGKENTWLDEFFKHFKWRTGFWRMDTVEKINFQWNFYQYIEDDLLRFISMSVVHW